MVKRQSLKKEKNLKMIGQILMRYREALNLERKGRAYFIEDRVKKNLLPENWISEKTLTNFENGNNMPKIKNFKYLAIAFEIEFITLMKAIEPFLLSEDE